ncbi:MAG TPA: hypothetical protein VFP14_10010 [Novosphingobium sp.]|nr:hypothetical protein [Novosphingobium sp.]
MRTCLIAALAATLLVGSPTTAAEPTTTASATGRPDQGTQLSKLREGDFSVDLKALRREHGSTQWEEAKNQFAKLETAPDEALSAARKQLDEDWLTPEAHLVAEIALSRLSRKDEAAKHHVFLLAWLRSVTGDRDGLTAATAWNATSVNEEYFALMLMGRQAEGQSLVNSKDGVFDVMHTTDRKSGAKGDIWFDISSFYGKEFGLGSASARPVDPALQGR